MSTNPSRLWVLAPLLLLAAGPAAGQATIGCVQPAEPPVAGAACAGNRSGGSAEEAVLLRIRHDDGRWLDSVDAVDVQPSAGAVRTSRIDETGHLRIEWVGPVPATDTVRLHVTVRDGRGTTRREVRLLPASASSGLRLERLRGDGQYWYAGQQLRRPVAVRIDPVADSGQCRATLVVFRAMGAAAAASPDSVYGRWRYEPETGAAGLCEAEARWRLAGDLGVQHLRARLGRDPGQQQVFTAHARSRPRFLAGLAVTTESSHWTVADSTWSGRVSSTAEGTTIAFDSVARWVRAKEAARDPVFTPTLGLDFPLLAWYPRVRATVAISITDPTEDFFVGMSILQVPFRLAQEGVGFDLHAVARLNRSERVRGRAECREPAWRHALPEDCVSSGPRLLDGAGVLATVDGAQLMATLFRAFGVP